LNLDAVRKFSFRNGRAHLFTQGHNAFTRSDWVTARIRPILPNSLTSTRTIFVPFRRCAAFWPIPASGQEPDSRYRLVEDTSWRAEFRIHNPIPPEGTVVGTYDNVAIEDKGAAKGAILHQIKKLSDKASGQLLATVRSVLFLRGDGGCGSFGEAPGSAQPLRESSPSSACEIATLPQSALIYRLSGDYNPIHADPEAAAKAGFEARSCTACARLALRPARYCRHSKAAAPNA